MRLTDLSQGIPDHVQQERQPQSPAARPAAQTQSSSRSAAPVSGDVPAEASNPENINLFEAAAAAANQRSGGGRGGAGAGGLGNLDFLRNNPQFQQLRQVVQQQPQMLEPILQQVGSGNPQLAALISQNPDAFLQLLSEDPDDGEGAALPPGAQQIAVTPEERDAIERVCPPRTKLSNLSLGGLCMNLSKANVWRSYVVLALTGTWSFKRTSHATRTKNSQRISCSSSQMMIWNRKCLVEWSLWNNFLLSFFSFLFSLFSFLATRT